MNDIFISYANADRAVAQPLADALEALGWSVWWDREIPFGKPFDVVIEQELNAARCVIVLWSKESVRSRWVKTEAGAAADRDRLMPVLIEDVAIPLEFRRIQTAMLQGWKGDLELPEYKMLIESVRQMLGQPPSPPISTHAHTARGSTSRSGQRKNIAIVVGALLVVLVLGILGKTPLFESREPESASALSPPAASSSSRTRPGADASSVAAASIPATAATASLAPVKGAFAIKIGDRIDDGVPVAGAGNIESPGAKDVYTFTAKAGQHVYFRMLKHGKDVAYIGWKLADPEGNEIFNSRLSSHEPGVRLLKKGGTYTMTVGSDSEPGVGEYRLQLFDVPPAHQFSIKVGDTIKENTPGAGAGEIESPGAKDVYTFTAKAGQRVYFRMFKHAKDMAYVGWKLTDPEDNDIFDTRLSSSEPGVRLLKKAGTYRLTVGSDTEPGVGEYRLQLFDVPPPQQFSIKVGDAIKENTPGAGAGEIESPGASDVYTFAAVAGQRVYFRMLKHDKDMAYVGWKLTDPDGNEIFNTRLSSSEPGVQVLRKAGTYTITVGSDVEPGTGTYSLQLSSAGS